MKISIWTGFAPESDILDAVIMAASAGFKYVELSHNHTEQMINRAKPSIEVIALNKVCEYLGVSIIQGHLIHLSELAHPDRSFRELQLDHLKRQLDLYMALNIPVAVVHPGGNVAGFSEEQIDQWRVETLQGMLHHIAGSKLKIALETMYSRPFTSKSLLKIIEQVDSPALGVCLDTGHLNMTDEKHIDCIKNVKDKLIATHIHDNTKQGMDEHLLPFSAGCVPWREVIGGLKSINYQAGFNFELTGEFNIPAELMPTKLKYVRQLADVLVNL